jgi:hypothetical protein
MALTPINTDPNQFPLSISPYLSRVSSHAEEIKNYSMLAFNPGFALQAAELNELQEIFFLNQSLSQRMNANWILFNTTQSTPYSAPFWEGLIPLSPSYLTISQQTFNANGFSFTCTLSSGWYLYTDPKSKLSFWAWKDEPFTATFSGNSTQYFGLNVTTSYINCCQTDSDCGETQDGTLRDASQSVYQDFTCSSSRFKISIGNTMQGFTSIPAQPTTFSYIFRADTTAQKIIFPNNFQK